jgi:acetylornithine/succinyldiaminopimelate/putrescine aminotransferase
MMTIAKPLAGGLAAAAVLCNTTASSLLVPGDHGTTFGGSPLTAAASLYVMERVSQPAFLQAVTDAGDYMRERITRMEGAISPRGRGLITGFDVEPSRPAADVVAQCREQGLFVHSAGPHTLRLLPALNISLDDMDEGLDILQSVLKHNQ